MIKKFQHYFIFILWLSFALLPQIVLANEAKENAVNCSAEKLQKIEENLNKSAIEGLKVSQKLLETYNASAQKYISTCNQNLNTGTPVHWTSDAIAAAYAKDKSIAGKLMGDMSQYKYTGIVWTSETPTTKECSKLHNDAETALQDYNNSRVTTTALLGRAGGNKMPRACVCSENADNQKCVAYATADEEPKLSADGCKVFNEYLSDLATCPLCPIFEIILNTDGKIAHMAWISLAGPLRGVVAVFFLVFLALETLKLVASMGGASTSSYLKSILTLGLKVAITLILLTNSSYVYGYFISPVVKSGLEMGQEFLKMGTGDASEIANCSLNDSSMTFGSIEGNELDSSILSNIYESIHCFNNSALYLPAIGKSLMCHGWEHGGNWHFPDLEMWLAGAINYIFGLMIWLAIAFYLIDCTVQLGMICAFVPMFIAFWPFKMTQRYTYIGVKIIVNTFFNFVLMGVVMLVGAEIVTFALQTGNHGMETASLMASLNNQDINAEKLKKVVNLDGASILCLIACCIMALKLISTANSAASKFSSGSGMDIGRKVGGLAGSAAQSMALGVGSAGLTFAVATAKGIGKGIGRKAAKTDAGRYVARKYRSGVNAVRGAFGLPQRQTGSGLPDEKAQNTTTETTHSQNQNSENSQTTQNQQHNSQNQNSDNSQTANNQEKATYDNGQPKFSETTDENGNTNRKNFDENGNVTSETKTDKNGNEVEYKAYHANGELATHHTVDENGTRHWQTFNEDKTLSTEGSYNEKTGDRTEKKYDHGQLTSERTDGGNGDYSYKTYHSNGKTKQEGKGNINTGGHHISYDEEQNVTRKWHTFEKGQTDE